MYLPKQLLSFAAIGLFVLGSVSCSFGSPVASERILFSTKLSTSTTMNIADQAELTRPDFRDIVAIGATSGSKPQLFFREDKDGQRILKQADTSSEKELYRGPNIDHEVVRKDGTVVFLTAEVDGEDNTIWTMRDSSGKTLYHGEITNIIKSDHNQLIFSAQQEGESHIYVNGKEVWKSPYPVTDFVFDEDLSRYAAVVVLDAKKSIVALETSFAEVDGQYEWIYGLSFDPEGNISFLAKHLESAGWTWYRDGELIPLEENIREVASVATGSDEMMALVRILEGDKDAWYAISSGGEKISIPGEPSRLIETDSGWSTILLRESGYKAIYDISSGEKGLVENELNIIPISPSTDIWYAKRGEQEANWTLMRGEDLVGQFVSYSGPYSIDGKTNLIAEKSNGEIVLLEIDP